MKSGFEIFSKLNKGKRQTRGEVICLKKQQVPHAHDWAAGV